MTWRIALTSDFSALNLASVTHAGQVTFASCLTRDNEREIPGARKGGGPVWLMGWLCLGVMLLPTGNCGPG